MLLATGRQCLSPDHLTSSSFCRWHILQHWIVKNDDDRLVTVLSAIDVACCNHSVRPAFLELAGSRLFSWSTDRDNWSEHLEVRDLVSHSKWLKSRQVRVRRLVACDCSLKELHKDDHMSQLPFIDTIVSHIIECHGQN